VGRLRVVLRLGDERTSRAGLQRVYAVGVIFPANSQTRAGSGRLRTDLFGWATGSYGRG
jgi:hypothetical protein